MYITESKPTGETNVALPKSIRSGYHVIDRKVDQNSTTAYFVNSSRIANR